jgi:hypothetical protein
MLEFNPTVFEVANRFLAGPLRLEETAYRLPSAPGLGAVVIEDALRAENLESEILYYYDS